MTSKPNRKGVPKRATVIASVALLLSACQTLDDLRVYTSSDYDAMAVVDIQQKIKIVDYTDYRAIEGPRIVLGDMQYAYFRKLIDQKTGAVKFDVKLELTYIEPKRNYDRARDTMGQRFEVQNRIANGGCYSQNVCTAVEYVNVQIPADYAQSHTYDGIMLSAISDDHKWNADVSIPAAYLQAVMELKIVAESAS